MAPVQMAVRGDAHQPCLRVIKNAEHRQNKNGVQQAVAVFSTETPAAVLDSEVFSPSGRAVTIKKTKGTLARPL
jgi:hypothetical protein